MKQDESKMLLAETAAVEAQTAHNSAVEEFLDPEKRGASNVIGMGVGVKWKKGQPTGEPALVVLVTQKLDKEQVSKADLVPSKLAGMQTDVLEVGYPFAGESEPLTAGSQALTKHTRPAKGGCSVGHFKVTAGTIATCVYDISPESTGIPSKYYILSNNHVLANSNNASPGDPILQPGVHDGGANPADCIAHLSKFIPITFSPQVPLDKHNNLVDAAIAEGQFHELNREIYWTGYVRGWRPKARVLVGTLVQKTGRTTNYTTGRITAINATVNVNFGGGRVARFRDQIITTNMSAGGDSGSLVTTLDDVAVGLLFAGSPVATIINQIENVRSLLKIEVAEQIL